MHEVENDEGSLDRGDGESDDNIEFTKILECGPNGDGGAEHQGRKDDDVNSRRNNVLGHARLLQTLLPVPVNQIQQREQIDPHNIDEVPVQTHDFNGGVVLRREAASEGTFDEPEEEAGAHDHVQGVQTCHPKVEGEIKLTVRIDVRIVRESLFDFFFLQSQFFWIIAGHGMRGVVLHVKAAARNEVVVELLLVFDSFDAKKDGTEAKGGDQENADQFLFTNLGRPDSHGHSQTAHNQHNGVAGAQGDVKSIAADAESGAEHAAIDGVSEEQATEEQDFGHQENPHAERGGFFLLLERLKLSVQIAGAVHSVLLFLSQRRAWLGPRTGRTEVRPYIKIKVASRLPERARAAVLLPPNQDRGGSESRMVPR